MENNQDYSPFYKFINKFSPIGFSEISRDDTLITDLETMMETNNQFFFVGDVIDFKVLFTSKRSTQMIGADPENVIPHLFFEAIHSDDIQRYSLARTKLIKSAQEFYINGKGSTLLSSNLKTLGVDGKYRSLLFQCYLFYSETPVKTVYMLQIHTNLDWCKKIKKEHHYYLGNDLSHFKYPDEELLRIGNIYTKRELEIVKLIQLGLSSEQIAEKLFVSLHTINAHRGNILKKTDKTCISELIYDLIEQGTL